MIFETHQLNGPLASWIDSIFHYKDYVPKPGHEIERVVPTGNLFLLFELDNIPRHTFDPATLEPNATFRRAWVSGMHQNHLTISAHRHSEMLVVQFKATGAYPFVHRPVQQFNDLVLPAEAVFGDEIVVLRDEILGKDTANGKFLLVEDWLLGRMDNTKLPAEEITLLVEAFRDEPFHKHQRIISDYPQTQKTLIQQFKKYCGLTPKTLHRIFRFNKLLEAIKEKNEIHWAHIAYETGFSDQSHFIKDFHNFSGFNPSGYIKNEYNKQPPNFFPVGKKASEG